MWNLEGIAVQSSRFSIVWAVVLLAACSATTASPIRPGSQPDRPAARPVVKVGTLAAVGDAGWWIGIDRGYFQEAGIELSYETFDSAAAMVAPLASGQLDIGGGAISAGLYNAIARGVEIKAVADKSSSPPGHGTIGLVVRKDLWDSGRVQSPADLRGLKLGLAGSGVAPETELTMFLEPAGLTLKDLEVVNMSFGDMVAALSNGALDLAIAPEPFLTTMRNVGVGHVWVRSDEMLPGHVTSVILYSPKFVEQRDVALKLMIAYLKGVRDYNDAFFKNDLEKRAMVVASLARHTTLKDPALYDEIVVQGIDPNGTIPIASLEQDQRYFLASGLQEQRIDLAKVVDMSYAEAAVRTLGRY
jgi:NitT/TauT family transport system substrate-binding protein